MVVAPEIVLPSVRGALGRHKKVRMRQWYQCVKRSSGAANRRESARLASGVKSRSSDPIIAEMETGAPPTVLPATQKPNPSSRMPNNAAYKAFMLRGKGSGTGPKHFRPRQYTPAVVRNPLVRVGNLTRVVVRGQFCSAERTGLTYWSISWPHVCDSQ